MPILTSQLLRNFPYTRRAGAAVAQRGRAYQAEGRITEIDLRNDRIAVCQVEGDSGDYEVQVRAVAGKDGLAFTCDCPHADDGNFCKHMVAAGLELAEYLDEEAEGRDEIEDLRAFRAPDRQPARPAPVRRKPWQAKLDLTLTGGPYRDPVSPAARYVGVVLLEREVTPAYNYYPYYRYQRPAGNNPTYKLVPYVLPAAEWPALAGGAAEHGPTAINALLKADRKWFRFGHRPSRIMAPGDFLNLAPGAAAFLNLLIKQPQTYPDQGADQLPALLTLLAKLDLPLFKGSARNRRLEHPLRFWPDPVAITVDLRAAKAGLSLVPGIEAAGEFQPLEPPVVTLSEHPAWILHAGVIAELKDPAARTLLAAFPLKVPAGEADAFRDDYLAQLAQTLPLREGLVHWRDLRTDPIPRLYLRDDRASGLCAELRFGYGDHELPAAKMAPAQSIVAVPDTWDLVRVQRDPEKETALLDSLAGPAYGLKRRAAETYGTHALRAKVLPFDFLLQHVPRLAQAGFEVYGEESLKVGKLNRNPPRLQVTISSGLDWFDLKMTVEYGDQQVSLQAIRQALQRGERFVKLADGSVGQVPAEWLAKYRHLWKLATETKDGLRVSDVQLPLIDSLLEDDATLKVPADLKKRRQRLRDFKRIAVQPPARGFIGQLRPYQRHGVDWLHFLRDFKFGGLLADDMGLGKTIQVLAFLQGLKERGRQRSRPASLLVVPKSLIANWQREAEKFAPALRFLPYVGQFRIKDATAFQGYDVVLTTYGTLLRDINRLRQYRFHYAILDESQAIKNPLAKSAKAARQLEAEHRLALTGTPVENNTLELWSQFAFLNPGLLGSLDFFRQEFAAPIESQNDEAAAATLRQLVYPFILRRTKAQVAPELPPRAERVIYSDMDSAQRKLYTQTRERYRAELLGLIETSGINDARFKILEGLLRLRQIALHPGLVDGRYRGAAPKLELLLETLETLQAENHKALVFSQFVGMLRFVRRELDARRLKYVYLDGQTTDRQARVDLFQNDPAYPFFLISLKAGGVGLNLTAAEYVIHLDPWWNPAVEMQASDRAHRIGQAKPVFVYKLIARGTVEEKILQLQEKKRALVKSLITTEAGFFKSLTPEDVQALFG